MNSQTLTPPPACPEIPNGWPPGAQRWQDDPSPPDDADSSAWYQRDYRSSEEAWALRYMKRAQELEADNERLERCVANMEARVAKIGRIEELVADHGPCSEAPDNPDEPQVCGDDLCAWCAVVTVIDDIAIPPVDDRTSEHE